MKNNTLNLFIKLMTWLNVYWFPNVPEVDMHTNKYVSHIISLITNTGIINTIKRIKLYRLCVTKYLCGQPLDKVPMVIGLTRSGFPKQIKGMKALIDSGQTSSIRFVLTLLGLSRALKAEGTVSYASITDPQVINEQVLKAIVDFIPIFIQDNNLDIYEGSWNKMDSNLSTKAGPHGLATWTSWKSVFYLPEHLILSIKEFGGQELYEFITSIRSNFDIRIMEKFFDLKDTIKVRSKDLNAKKVKTFKAFKSTTDIRKLSIVHDPELKERVIAILDWFSQESLRPFHNYCFSLLRSMKQDRTFTQDPIITDKLEKHSYHSLDLSAATDRFPIRLQKSLVEHLTGSAAKAQAWETILTSIPYRTPEGDYIKYNVGQPMGAYSSWAVFTLSHHLLVQYAAYKLGYTKFKEYILLGDDIVIYHDKVAKLYTELVVEIGAEISLMKSHTSPNCYEFAKRWFRNGIEVSGIPVRGFLDNINKYHILYMNVISLIDRNLHTARYTTIPDLVMSLLRVTTNLKNRQYANLYSRLTSLHAMHLYLHTDNKLQLRNLLDGKVQGFSLPTQEDELFGFLEMVVRKSADSMLADNARRLSTYCNDLIGAIYAKTDQMVEQTNGWRPSIKDFGLIPIIPAIFSEMKITVQGLVMPSHTKSIKDLIKILDFEDPERASTIRTSFRLICTESKLFKQCLITLRSMSRDETIPFTMNPRATIAVNELAKVGSLLDVNNPRAPLTLGLSPFGGLGGKAMLKDFRTLMETQ
jgi:hypothetical protein